jgi:hypothetical protein
MAEGADAAGIEARLVLTRLAESTHDQTLARSAEQIAVASHDDAELWAASGAMHLTGHADRPPLFPLAPVASRLAGAAAVWSHLSGLPLDGPALLGERAALRGLSRRGRTSAGGGSQILRTADGWVAVTLSRADDRELVPAWLQVDDADDETISNAVAVASAAATAATGQELGLAVAVVAPPSASRDEQQLARGTHPWLISPGDGPAARGRLRVLDLSALWAGPLCANLLGLAGADVLTVDSVGRPDGARLGDPDLFALLHKGHASVPVDLRQRDDRGRLGELIGAADVVITSVRPRALAQLELWPHDQVARRPGLTWVAITAYGLTGPWSNRVGYGDDTAAAGGLVAIDGSPVFCADAAADPCTGLYAAIAATAVAGAGGGVVDVALREVAAHLARAPHRTEPAHLRRVDVALPRARTA